MLGCFERKKETRVAVSTASPYEEIIAKKGDIRGPDNLQEWIVGLPEETLYANSGVSVFAPNSAGSHREQKGHTPLRRLPAPGHESFREDTVRAASRTPVPPGALPPPAAGRIPECRGFYSRPDEIDSRPVRLWP